MSATVPLPLANDPSTRTETGEIKDQATAPLTEKTIEPTPTGTTSSTDQTSSTTETLTAEPKPEPSLLNKDDTKPASAATEYKPFTVPEGYELVPEVATEANTIFKELGLNQDQAQRLVDFYGKQVKSVSEAPETAWNTMNKEWSDKTMADPELGPHIAKVKETISRALDSVGDAKLTAEFKSVMDLTGAGNHPAFVKAFYKMAQAVTEGHHVRGGNPSPLGQTEPGRAARPSAAQALYPNLTSSG